MSKLFWSILICGIRVKKTLGLMSGRNDKYEWTRNFTRALMLANIWLICGNKIIQVDINTWRIQFCANCGMYTYLIQSKDKTTTSKSNFFRKSINFILWLSQKQMNTFVGTSGIAKLINHLFVYTSFILKTPMMLSNSKKFTKIFVLCTAIFQALILNTYRA